MQVCCLLVYELFLLGRICSITEEPDPQFHDDPCMTIQSQEAKLNMYSA